jgi:hypothetical protein
LPQATDFFLVFGKPALGLSQRKLLKRIRVAHEFQGAGHAVGLGGV